MMKTHRSICFAASLFASTIAQCPAASALTAANGGIAAESPALDLPAALAARSPHPSLGDQARVFDRFVGTWEVQYRDILKDGRTLNRTGLFIVGWVMYGRAIQDIWIVDPSPGHAEKEIYADVRYLDPKTHTWPSIFIDPEHASMARFSGGAVAEDQIVLQTSDLGAKLTRWSFEDIEANAFVFRDEFSRDEGKTWTLQSEYHMRRKAPAAT
jgi:hypothetical protein